MARLDKYLAKLNGEDVTPPAPVTRLDKSLAHAIDGDVDLPAPIASIDKHMTEISAGGDGNFTEAEIEVDNQTANSIVIGLPTAYEAGEAGEEMPALCACQFVVPPLTKLTRRITLYKGAAMGLGDWGDATVTASGGVNVIGGMAIMATGNGTITATTPK